MSLVDAPRTYLAYVYGTSFWYFLRGLMRIIDPVAVIGWFRPPVQRMLPANDLEIYTTRTDAFGLITLAAILLILSDAVTLPKSLVGSSFTVPASERAKKPYARAVLILTLFHHVTTGIGSFQHWIKPTHRTLAMDIGVFGNLALTALGIVALLYGLNDDDDANRKSPKKSR